jgi:hypothetical protein
MREGDRHADGMLAGRKQAGSRQTGRQIGRQVGIHAGRKQTDR